MREKITLFSSIFKRTWFISLIFLHLVKRKCQHNEVSVTSSINALYSHIVIGNIMHKSTQLYSTFISMTGLQEKCIKHHFNNKNSNVE